MNIIVNTGAILPLVAKKVYGRVKDCNSFFETLIEVRQPVLLVNNDPLTSYGKLRIPISMANYLSSTEVVVTDLTVDGITGLFFWIRSKSALNLKKQILGTNEKINISE